MLNHGLVLAVGLDSVGYLTRLILHADSCIGAKLNWRTGCVRSVCGHGFALCQYEVSPDLYNTVKGHLDAFRAAEHDNRLIVDIKDADPNLANLLDAHAAANEIYSLSISFSHRPQPGFLGELCRLLPQENVHIVQHDSIMKKSSASRRNVSGEVYHEMRCFVPPNQHGGSVDKARLAILECINAASEGTFSGEVLVQEPKPEMFLQGTFPEECWRAGRDLGYLYVVVDTRNRIPTGAQPPAAVFSQIFAATEVLGKTADSAELSRLTQAGAPIVDRRSSIRSSMRWMGGWAFAVFCVPVINPGHAEDMRKILQSRLESWDYCGARMAQSSPWQDDSAARCLRLTYPDAEGSLADYLRYIGDELTAEVSIAQYDSSTRAADRVLATQPLAEHRLTIACNPAMSLEDRTILIRKWIARHEGWASSKRNQWFRISL